MTFKVDKDSLKAFAHDRGDGGLRASLAPLHTLPGPSIWHTQARAAQDAVSEALAGAKKAMEKSRRERLLGRMQMPRFRLERAYEEYGKRLPEAWLDHVSWTQWIYQTNIPAQLTRLRDAFDDHIRIESALLVSGEWSNRDHILHQLADGFTAARLFDCWSATDIDERRETKETKNHLATLGPTPSSNWSSIWKAALVVAGMFHDIGYVRYVAEAGLRGMRDHFGQGPEILGPPDAAALARLLHDTVLRRLAEDTSVDPKQRAMEATSLLVEHAREAWDQGDHGPTSATAFLLQAEDLRRRGVFCADVEAVLQLATVAAWCHEIHPTEAEHVNAGPAMQELRRRFNQKDLTLPLLFRFVDDLQCWYRSGLEPQRANAGVVALDFGSCLGFETDGDGLLKPTAGTWPRKKGKDGKQKERLALHYLLTDQDNTPFRERVLPKLHVYPRSSS